jgi:type II secretory pathway predicted ATPase ExeA
MYLDLFRLKALPFRLSPDASYLYSSGPHDEARACMAAAVERPDGIVVITGDTGAGKTTVIEGFLAGLDAAVVVARLNQTQVTAIGFLQGLLVQFGFSPFTMTRAEMLMTISAFLTAQQAAGRRVLLVVDEAQNLAADVLAEVARLSDADSGAGQPIAIVLAGQPALAELLESPAVAAVAARVRRRVRVAPLSTAEIDAYIQHRLDIAGAEGRPFFDDAALELVRRYTGGVPRLVNTLCDTALMQAWEQHTLPAGVTHVRAAVDALQWVEYAARGPAPRRPYPAFPEPVPMPAPVAAVLPESPREQALGYVQLAHDGRIVAALELRSGRIIVGRTSENDLQIDSKYVSRHHCQITVSAEGTVIEDLNSTNGIHVRGERVRRYVLTDGDAVTVGQHTLTYLAMPPTDSNP